MFTDSEVAGESSALPSSILLVPAADGGRLAIHFLGLARTAWPQLNSRHWSNYKQQVLSEVLATRANLSVIALLFRDQLYPTADAKQCLPGLLKSQ